MYGLKPVPFKLRPIPLVRRFDSPLWGEEIFAEQVPRIPFRAILGYSRILPPGGNPKDISTAANSFSRLNAISFSRLRRGELSGTSLRRPGRIGLSDLHQAQRVYVDDEVAPWDIGFAGVG
jgi:hypothetical protein